MIPFLGLGLQIGRYLVLYSSRTRLISCTECSSAIPVSISELQGVTVAVKMQLSAQQGLLCVLNISSNR